jgi:hypothetical protein
MVMRAGPKTRQRVDADRVTAGPGNAAVGDDVGMSDGYAKDPRRRGRGSGALGGCDGVECRKRERAEVVSDKNGDKVIGVESVEYSVW